MYLFFGLSGLIVLPLAVYLYILISRFLGLFWEKSVLRRLAAGFLAVLIALPCMNLFGLPAMVILHFAAASLLVQLLRWIMKRAKKPWTGLGDILYRSSAIALIATLVILGYAYCNMHHIITASYTVATEKSIRSGGYDILFLSDLHYGTTMERARLSKVCTDMAASRPDVVILGGDIVDESATASQVREAFQLLGDIPSTYGTYYVYGNHDKGRYYAGCDFTPAELAEAIRASDIQILEDETVSLNAELTLSGRIDRSDAAMDGSIRPPAETLLRGSSQDAFHILADHQPREMTQNAAAGFDLMLSGHTHAGQIWPVGLITTLFDKETFNYGEKSYDNMTLIVSSGIAGWGYPFRTGKHSEYVLVHIAGPA